MKSISGMVKIRGRKSAVRIDCGAYELKSLGSENLQPVLADWLSDEELLAFMQFPTNWNWYQIEKYFASFDNATRFALGIWRKDSPDLIGFYRVYLQTYHSRADTSVIIGDKEYWGTGIVVETRVSLLDFLFFELKINKVCGVVHARNIPALFNYRKQGFRKEAVLAQHYKDRHGQLYDAVQFGMLREDWLDRRDQMAPKS